MKNFQLSGNIAVAIKKTRGRSLCLVVKPGGRVELRLPLWVSYRRGLTYLRSKKEWIAEKHRIQSQAELPFLQRGSGAEFAKLRNEARRLILSRIHIWAPFYNVIPKKVIIRNQRSRWGSCSRLGTLSFSYRLLFLPEELRDYIVVHELCHLKEFNHSKRFWALVANTFPDYLKCRRILRLI